MTITRRDLIKTAAVAAVLPGTALASLGKTSPVEPKVVEPNFYIGDYNPTATWRVFLTDPVQHEDYGVRLEFFHDFLPKLYAYKIFVSHGPHKGCYATPDYVIGVWGMKPENEQFEQELLLKVESETLYYRWGKDPLDCCWVQNDWTNAVIPDSRWSNRLVSPGSSRLWHGEEGRSRFLAVLEPVSRWGHRFVTDPLNPETTENAVGEFIHPEQLREKFIYPELREN